MGGAPYTNEAAGGENYNTIMSLAISKKMVMWFGLVPTMACSPNRNGGKDWVNITPKGLKPGL